MVIRDVLLSVFFLFFKINLTALLARSGSGPLLSFNSLHHHMRYEEETLVEKEPGPPLARRRRQP